MQTQTKKQTQQRVDSNNINTYFLYDKENNLIRKINTLAKGFSPDSEWMKAIDKKAVRFLKVSN